jgi:hypothetical protein
VRIRHHLTILAPNHARSPTGSSGEHLNGHAPELFGNFSKGA